MLKVLCGMSSCIKRHSSLSRNQFIETGCRCLIFKQSSLLANPVGLDPESIVVQGPVEEDNFRHRLGLIARKGLPR